MKPFTWRVSSSGLRYGFCVVSALFIVESLLCRRGSVVLGSVLLDEQANLHSVVEVEKGGCCSVTAWNCAFPVVVHSPCDSL